MSTATISAPPRVAQKPLVSVIIPVFQGERFILGAVESALRQTHRELEVFVVDDGSTDATLERLATVRDPRLHVLRQSNAGAGAARNAALAQARGAYVAFLDCDDRWFADKIATEVALLEGAARGAAIAYSSHYAVDDDGRLLHAARVRTHAGPALDLLLDGEDFLMPSLCLFDRRIFEVVGAFDVQTYHEDHDFMLRALRRFPIVPTGRRLGVYRQTLGGRCRSILADFDAARTAELSIVAKFATMLSREQTERLRANVLRSLYYRFLMYGFNANAARLLREIDRSTLTGGVKGRLGRLFAHTGINAISPARTAVQTFHRHARQGWWQRRLSRDGLELQYD